MNTKILDLKGKTGTEYEKGIKEAGEIIRNGGLVAFPTETVYGLGANALSDIPCGRVFDAKGRPHDNPLIVHVAFPEDFEKYAYEDDFGLYRKLAERFMPGPLTVILKKKSNISSEVSVGLDTVAIRCPINKIAHDLIFEAGVPIAAPSANLSGRPSPTSFSHVYEDMFGKIEMIIDGGNCEVGLESTVVSIKDGKIRLLRPGFITYEMLSEIAEVEMDKAVLSAISKDAKPESPGMKYRHYAPLSPVTMIKGKDEEVIAFFNEEIRKGNGILCFEEDLPFLEKSEKIVTFGKKNDYLSQANSLFDSLRKFDSMNVGHIFARFTEHDNLGLAVSNRLLRACAFDIKEI